MARPAYTEPPGELMYSQMSFSGSSPARKSNCAMTTLRDLVVDGRADEDDAVFEQPRVDVHSAFAPIGVSMTCGIRLVGFITLRAPLLALVFEGDVEPSAEASDLAVLDGEIEPDDLRDAQVAQRRRSGLDRDLGSLLPGFGARPNQ